MPSQAKPEYEKQGRGEAFVYVAGAEGTGKLFYKQAADLKRDHTVITFPLRPSGRYALADLVGDLRNVVRDAGIKRATFLGESFGGLVVLSAALSFPKMFARMILVNTFPYFPHRAKINFGVALYSMLPYAWIKNYRARRNGTVLFGENVAEEDRQIFRERTRIVPREGYVSRLHIIRDTDLRPRLAEIKVPALVVAGTRDNLLDSEASARLMANAMPNARLKLLEGECHSALLSRRVRVREWLEEFD